MTTEAPTTTIEELVQEVLDETERCVCRATDCPHEAHDPEGQCLANAKYRLVGLAGNVGPVLLCELCFRFLCEAMKIDFDYLLATGHRRDAGSKKDAG